MSVRSPYIDILDWDPVRFSVQIADVTDEGLHAYFEAVEARLRADHAASRHYVLVFDPRHGRPPSIEQRLIQARFVEQTRALVSDINIGVALCTPSPLLRGMMSALFWVARSPSPQVSLPSMSAALAWAVERATHAGLDVPRAVVEEPAAVLAAVEARALAARF